MKELDVMLKEIYTITYRNCLQYNGFIPSQVGTKDGKHLPDAPGHWTDGFWPGILLLIYADIGDEVMLKEYRRIEGLLAERLLNDQVLNEQKNYLALDHDVGFIFFLTFVYDYMINNNHVGKERGLRAADFLMNRYHEKGRFLHAWNDWPWDTPEFREEKKGKVIIDSLMNVPLLFWASEVTGETDYREKAISHIDTVRNNMIREDGSTFHTFNFDPFTGLPIEGKTVQGYNDDSCWSRGHAWAIYGFALAYRYTNDKLNLEAAERCIAYWQGSALPSLDAPWDFNAPRNDNLPIDTSAMAIAACGIMELSDQLNNRHDLYEYAKFIIHRLMEFHTADPTSNSFLIHGCVGPAYRKGSTEELKKKYIRDDQSLIYGDYFFLEALLRLKGDVKLPWHFDK